MSGFYEDERIRNKNRIHNGSVSGKKPITLEIDDSVDVFEMIDALTEVGYQIVLNEGTGSKKITIKK